MEQDSATGTPKDSVDEGESNQVAVKDEDSQDLVIDEADYELDDNISGPDLSKSLADPGIDAGVETSTQTIQPDFSNSGVSELRDENNRSKKHMRKMPHILRRGAQLPDNITSVIAEVDSDVKELLENSSKDYRLTEYGPKRYKPDRRTYASKDDMIKEGILKEDPVKGMMCTLCGYEAGIKGWSRMGRHMEGKHSLGPGYPCPETLCTYVGKYTPSF